MVIFYYPHFTHEKDRGVNKLHSRFQLEPPSSALLTTSVIRIAQNKMNERLFHFLNYKK